MKKGRQETKNWELSSRKTKTVYETLNFVILVPTKWRKVDSKPTIENLVQGKQRTAYETLTFVILVPKTENWQAGNQNFQT